MKILSRLIASGPAIVAYIAAWEWIGVLGVVGVFLIAHVVTSHIAAPAAWRLLMKVGKDPEEIYLAEMRRIERRATA